MSPLRQTSEIADQGLLGGSWVAIRGDVIKFPNMGCNYSYSILLAPLVPKPTGPLP